MTAVKHLGFALSVFIALALSGCSQHLQRQTCMPLASEVSYCLAPLLNEPLRSQSLQVDLSIAGNRHQLLSQLELSSQQLTLVGLAPLGQALFTLTFDGQRLDSLQSRILGEQFKAEYLLGLLQLIYWPTETVNRHLHGATMTTVKCDAPLCRRLYANDNEANIIDIRYSQPQPWQAQVDLAVVPAELTLHIRPVE
ncbi:DUF3261 domain-containing protein [Shewanella algidipiscicola]|uniref:DUF3261 domain-containing protein n=1 Tax=Shewanella algidipiscicola TaxID=614070 RepID=A0ABQ4PG19_9GAMM|nr:DUF3261 domain-containing protein [Shewanella algidipiscicola]GIU46378.1 hypothetical protein TUM4630_16720 [Shewanella algidipiscicola]